MEPFLTLAAVCVVALRFQRHWVLPVAGCTFAGLHGALADAPAPWVYAGLMAVVNVVAYATIARIGRGARAALPPPPDLSG